MKSLRSRLVMVMTAGALVVLPSANPRATRTVDPRGAPDPKTLYSKSAREYWLSADEFGYIRPGLTITVNSITINADRHPVVDVTYTDDLNQPLDRKGQITAGPIATNMVLAWWDAGSRNYTSYTTRVRSGAAGSPYAGVPVTQAAADAQKSATVPNGGTWNDLDLGHAIYTFGTALPAGYDATVTTTLGIYATRNMINIEGGNFDKNYFDNVEQDFVGSFPNGAPVTEKWDMLSNAACNTCHNPLSAHGGSRQDVRLCVLCHSPQTVDANTHQTADFRVLIHKVHMGEDLPSVLAGTKYKWGNNDFSTVAFPQDIRNCATCHAPTYKNTENHDVVITQAPNWYTYPSRAACQSCHDDVNFATGENHPAGAQADDSLCASCHQPWGSEFDASIQGAHTVPFKSTQLKGIKATIVSVINTAPGQNPTIQFQLKQNDGTPINPASFGNFIAVIMGGPTTDYAINPFREVASSAAFDGTTATATYTFTNAVPANATGTWAFSVEARRSVPLNTASNDTLSVNESLFNPVYYAAVTDATPVPRRMVVDLANCNKCHDALMLHGSFRRNTEMCVICHNPNANDSARRPADQNPPESIDFKRMIHRIHTGEDLTHDYTIFGFFIPPALPNPINFNEVRFPGDRRDCEKCHVPGAQQVLEEPPPGLLPTQTLRDWYTPMQHFAAACLGCHDTQFAAAHAFTMTAPFPTGPAEACATCHGEDADFAVDKVHAR